MPAASARGPSVGRSHLAAGSDREGRIASVLHSSPVEHRGSLLHKIARFELSSWSEWQDLNLRPPRPERGYLAAAA
jgi:hypothetical protein